MTILLNRGLLACVASLPVVLAFLLVLLCLHAPVVACLLMKLTLKAKLCSGKNEMAGLG